MTWSGEVTFGKTWAAYIGQTADNRPHHHAAIQIIAGINEAVVVRDSEARTHQAPALLIPPLITHAIAQPTLAVLLYLEPHSPLAKALLAKHPSAEISELADELAAFIQPAQSPTQWIPTITHHLGLSTPALDPRLKKAMALLEDQLGTLSIIDAAKHAGLSESRLRELTRLQVGVPLATWLIWRKLERAARELASGASLTDAALAGAFSDQAHFAKAMRRMFGITPSTASTTLKQ